MKQFRKTTLVLIALGIVLCMGSVLSTTQMDWSIFRANVASDDTALDGTTAGSTYMYSDKPSTAITVNSKWNGVEVYFYGTDAADETCNYTIYAYKERGPAIEVCSGVFTLGTAITGVANEFYGDTITVTDVWPSDVTVSNSGNNKIATLSFDVRGYSWIFCEIDIPAASQVAKASASISGF